MNGTSETELAEALQEAGCTKAEAGQILASWRNGKQKETERMIGACRDRQLARLHESQKCIDRLDYLRYCLERKEH